VQGSVVMAFSEVCPDRFDMLHQRYRQLCAQLLDTDEWGQIAILTLLLRYARTQFVNPNQNVRRGREREREDKTTWRTHASSVKHSAVSL
jgi:AP-3 complex subunit beta